MTTHITEDIPRLLTGEANRDAVLVAAEHLRSCPDCQQELVSAVVAHASLTSAHRFAPEVVAPHGSDGSDGAHRLDDETGESEPPALPPMTDMFQQIRQEAERATQKKQAAPRRRLLSVAAAAVILVGGGAAIAEVATSSSSSTPSKQAVALTAFDRGHQQADVTIIGDRKVSINAAKLPKLDSNHVYELWLTDGARAHMQSVGLLGNDNTASFTVSSKSLTHYDNFEVSVQRTNQTAYSGISVLRGQYQS